MEMTTWPKRCTSGHIHIDRVTIIGNDIVAETFAYNIPEDLAISMALDAAREAYHSCYSQPFAIKVCRITAVGDDGQPTMSDVLLTAGRDLWLLE